MKILKQFLVILLISFIGEILNLVLPLPIPASIYGMTILFLGLVSGLIKLDDVKEAGKFLIEIMPVMFIPAGVGLMSSFGVLKPMLLPVSVITIVVLVAVMAVSGKVSQAVILRTNGKTEEES
ncbi:MAG TPA: murein hydrolase regulator LrgA [Lachnospiraceae bacterium]|nr:CidA/LrgA family protein [uncultured Lachnoclostridium sp.]HAU84815.1 murein hydrolase regulator LrgA [Lachnospiraceae bacterium]